MRVYVLLISGLVPLLLWLSFCLVSGRTLHDLLAKHGRPLAGRWLFSAILVVGAAIATLFGARTTLLAMGVSGLIHGNWSGADRSLHRYITLGGKPDAPLALDWANGLMQQHRFREARAVLFASAGRRAGHVALSREAVLAIGECLYYEGNLRQAEGALRVATRTERDYVRHYFLGRIAEKRGDPATAAIEYDAALRGSDEFFPAFYCATRLDLLRGDRASAQRRVGDYRTRHPRAAGNPLFPSLEAASRGAAAVPPHVEFYVTVTA